MSIKDEDEAIIGLRSARTLAVTSAGENEEEASWSGAGRDERIILEVVWFVWRKEVGRDGFIRLS